MPSLLIPQQLIILHPLPSPFKPLRLQAGTRLKGYKVIILYSKPLVKLKIINKSFLSPRLF